jgi:hypothetical protein
MIRKAVLALTCLCLADLALPDESARAAAPPRPASGVRPVALAPGPYLLLDDSLIEHRAHLVRRVQPPRRALEGPVVTGPEDRNDQPYVTVLRDPASKRFRMWYDASGDGKRSGLFSLGYLESEDGIHWLRPHRLLDGPPGMRWGASVLDEGPAYPTPARRFKLGWWRGGGLCVAASPDGLTWKPLAPGVVLKHNHDINSIARDPVRDCYVALVSVYTTGKRWQGKRRVTYQSVSADLVHWKQPWPILAPDEKDEGETQFYCVGGVIARGRTLVGMLKVLRDDLAADPGGRKRGVGYTVLAWSHDGEHWQRDRVPFLDRDPRKGAWDHAMAWADCQLPLGDEVLVYYGGYARGHKVERFTERQIGLVRLRRDRYVAWEAGDEEASLRTPLLTLEGKGLGLNVDAGKGCVRGQLTDPLGKPLPGFTFCDCEPITRDALAAPLAWRKPVAGLAGRPIRLELRLRRARLFAIEVHP